MEWPSSAYRDGWGYAAGIDHLIHSTRLADEYLRYSTRFPIASPRKSYSEWLKGLNSIRTCVSSFNIVVCVSLKMSTPYTWTPKSCAAANIDSGSS